MKREWRGTVLGQCESKANTRKIAITGRGRNARPRVIKSDKALRYAEDFVKQVRRPRFPLEGRLRLVATVYYTDERRDLDVSLILDLLQHCGVYTNDRQVREQHLFHAIDKKSPRAELLVQEIDG